MAPIILRNLEDDIHDKLRELARSQRQSIEETICEILRDTVMRKKAPQLGLGSKIAQRFSGKGLQEDIPELRGQSTEPPSFEQ